jgi:major membrane immunogen (membrane-anchored lipoprotein)
VRASGRVLRAIFLTMAVALAVTACTASASTTPGTAGTNQPGGADRLPAKGTLTGTVTVKVGGKVVCVMTVKAGKGTCKVSTADYKPGVVQFDATYSGAAGYKSSHSSTSMELKRKP